MQQNIREKLTGPESREGLTHQPKLCEFIFWIYDLSLGEHRHSSQWSHSVARRCVQWQTRLCSHLAGIWVCLLYYCSWTIRTQNEIPWFMFCHKVHSVLNHPFRCRSSYNQYPTGRSLAFSFVNWKKDSISRREKGLKDAIAKCKRRGGDNVRHKYEKKFSKFLELIKRLEIYITLTDWLTE